MDTSAMWLCQRCFDAGFYSRNKRIVLRGKRLYEGVLKKEEFSIALFCEVI